MRAVLLEVPEAMLEERRRHGLDKRDEMWEGELHMVPPAEFGHQDLSAGLIVAMDSAVRRHGFRRAAEAGVFDPEAGESDYRVPDLVVSRPEHVSRRGVEGRALLVIEIRSPGDETYRKIAFYARVGVEEMLIVDRDSRAVELLVRVGEELRPQAANEDGWFSSPGLGLRVKTRDGRLVVRDGETETVLP